jgi:hypothetical protein
MEVYVSTHIKRHQANLMLSDHYKNWSVSGRQSNSFPEEFALLRWDSLYRGRATDRLCISVKDNRTINILPSLNFSCFRKASNFEARVENSNATFNSRILGFDRIVNKDRELLEPGVYEYFYGEINFNGK